jgi:uncharacterized protein
MKEKILQYLKEIEKEKDIEILLACETGSRAWGFPSPNSDYDIRFIYRHPKDWYLSLNEKKDTIERMLENNNIDLSGWDLRKTLNLLNKSNPPLLEKIQSPIIYIANNDFIIEINKLAQTSYSKIATMHHYLSMAKKMYEEIRDKDKVKLKKLFYALRTSVACLWIIERDEPPPIVFQSMLEKLDIDGVVKQKIYDLIELKYLKNEDYFHIQEREINNFIEKCIFEADKISNFLSGSKSNTEVLNIFFIKYLQ